MSKQSFILSCAVIALTLISTNVMGQTLDLTKYKKALVIGAHPDDPECCCGGTAALLVQHGCEVVNVYLTGGEGGIPGKTAEEARAIRMKELQNACAILGTRYIVLTQIDGKTEITPERYTELREVIEREKPDIVFTHWPIDSHRDHRICSVLTYDAWRQLGHSFELYYHEAMSGTQTQNWHPDTYVDITSVVETKQKAFYAHASQHPDDMLELHTLMDSFHGRVFQCKYAETFTKQIWNDNSKQR